MHTGLHEYRHSAEPASILVSNRLRTMFLSIRRDHHASASGNFTVNDGLHFTPEHGTHAQLLYIFVVKNDCRSWRFCHISILCNSGNS